MDKVVLQVFTCRDVEMISSDLTTSNLIVTTKKRGVDQEIIQNCHIVLTTTPYYSKKL